MNPVGTVRCGSQWDCGFAQASPHGLSRPPPRPFLRFFEYLFAISSSWWQLVEVRLLGRPKRARQPENCPAHPLPRWVYHLPKEGRQCAKKAYWKNLDGPASPTRYWSACFLGRAFQKNPERSQPVSQKTRAIKVPSLPCPESIVVRVWAETWTWLLCNIGWITVRRTTCFLQRDSMMAILNLEAALRR
jgi:hypothetical protein